MHCANVESESRIEGRMRFLWCAMRVTACMEAVHLTSFSSYIPPFREAIVADA